MERSTVSEIGLILRDQRKVRGEVLYDMAKNLNMRTSKLSSIEYGRTWFSPEEEALLESVYSLYIDAN